MSSRVAPVATCLVLVLAGCSSPREEAVEEPLISSLPERCTSIGRAADPAEITFLVGDRLFTSLPDASDVRCVAELEGGGDKLTWGGEADRAAIDTPDGGLFLSRRGVELLPSGEVSPVFQGLSRPTGTSVVYISGDGKRLFKIPVEGGPPTDISFLARHDEVAYHPSGTSVIVTGEDGAGSQGIYFATNEGTDPRPLATAEDAERIYSLAFSHDGRTLYYAAEHEDRYDLHSLALRSKKDPAERLQTLHSSQLPIDNVVVSEFEEDPPVAYTEGDCATGMEAYAWTREGIARVGTAATDDFSKPAGWLPDGRLLVITRADGCDQAGTLEIWQGGYSDPVVGGVTEAAVRAVLPPPPGPLIPSEGVVP